MNFKKLFKRVPSDDVLVYNLRRIVTLCQPGYYMGGTLTICGKKYRYEAYSVKGSEKITIDLIEED